MKEVSHDPLVASGLLEEVSLGDDERVWLDAELASLAEHRLREVVDPRTLTAETRDRWRGTVSVDDETPLAHRDYQRAYWIVRDGRRVGTVALTDHLTGPGHVRLSSLYVFPDERGRGHAVWALDRLVETLGAQHVGVCLDTEWAWRKTVRFYLRHGWWVYMWKHSLRLFREARTPSPEIEVGDTKASLSVTVDGTRLVLIEAERDDDRLVWGTIAHEHFDDERLHGVAWHADSTLALAVAMAGWPMVRSAKDWAESRFGHGGAPEALAYKITLWEAFDRAHGWHVDQPPLPGLTYPTWASLTAGWDEDEEDNGQGT